MDAHSLSSEGGIARLHREAAWSADRGRTPEAVSVIVDLSMAPEQFQTIEVAMLAGPQVAAVDFDWMHLNESIHAESLGNGTFEVAVEVGTRRKHVGFAATQNNR